VIPLKPKLLVCDWNGTLLNDLWLAYLSTEKIFEFFGVPVPTLREYQNEIESDFSKFYIHHGITNFDLTINNAIRMQVFEENWDKVGLHDPKTAKHILMRMKQLGLKLAIVSAEIPEVLLRRIAQFDLGDVFDHVRGGAWPKNEALAEVLIHFDVKPEEAFYIDDTHEGISIAKKLGMKTFGFTEGYNTRERIIDAKPTYVVSSLEEAFFVLDRAFANNSIVIGITGEKGGGKETVGDILKMLVERDVRIGHLLHEVGEQRFSRHRFSDIINESLALWHLPSTRENQQKFGQMVNTGFGDGTLARAVRTRIMKCSTTVVVVDGIRRASEEEMIRSIPGSMILYVTAPVEARYGRPRFSRAGEIEKTFEQFLREEEAPTEVEIPRIGARAEHRIENTGSRESLLCSVKELFERYILPRLGLT